MTRDLWLCLRRGAARNPRADWLRRTLTLALFAAVAYVYYREACNPSADLAIHAGIAAQFDFSDLHSITSRVAYPMWHLLVSALSKLGAPVALSAAVVTAGFKTLAFWLAQRVFLCEKRGADYAMGLCLCAALMVVTGLRIPALNPNVYRGVGSPNVWHNPTQVAVEAVALLCVPYLMHCYCRYERAAADGGARVTLPWREAATLAVLLGLTPACKPTFMQALLPAAFVLFLGEWLRDRKQWRFFVRLALAFVPAAAYFLLQYLYYTGVVVEYTSGVQLLLTPQTLWVAVRSALVMAAFPLAALLLRRQKGERHDRSVLLGLWMLAFSVLEAAAFHETGMRAGHGNFTWAVGSSAFYLWYLALGRFWEHSLEAWRGRARKWPRALGYAACWALLSWHVYSGVYYLVFLLTTNIAF